MCTRQTPESTIRYVYALTASVSERATWLYRADNIGINESFRYHLCFSRPEEYTSIQYLA